MRRMGKRKDLGGRPPLPAGQARSERVTAFLRPDALATLQRIAAARGVPVGVVAREMLERAVRRAR